MAKFGTKTPDEDPTPPIERTVPAAVLPPITPAPVIPAPQVTVVDVNNNMNNSNMAQQTVQMQMQTAQVQAQSQVGLAEVSIDREMADQQIKKEDEHWMKAYWRPAMGWLYMLICFFDFVIAPVLSMLMPIFLKSLGANTVTYTQWQSLTLANGGLIHLAFGAILGVTAWGRTQEKNAANNAANSANNGNKPSGGSIATT